MLRNPGILLLVFVRVIVPPESSFLCCGFPFGSPLFRPARRRAGDYFSFAQMEPFLSYVLFNYLGIFSLALFSGAPSRRTFLRNPFSNVCALSRQSHVRLSGLSVSPFSLRRSTNWRLGVPLLIEGFPVSYFFFSFWSVSYVVGPLYAFFSLDLILPLGSSANMASPPVEITIFPFSLCPLSPTALRLTRLRILCA